MYKPRVKLVYDEDNEIKPSVRKKVLTLKQAETQALKTAKRQLVSMNFKNMELYRQTKIAKKSRDVAKETKKKHIKSAVARVTKCKNWRIRDAYRKVRRFANEKVALKLKRYTLTNNDYLASISSFPIITQWCKNSNVPFTTFSIFILLNHYEWFTSNDGVFFGYKKQFTTLHLKKLVALDLAHYKRGNITLYVASPLGKQTFVDFKKYHDEKLKELMVNFDKSVNPDTNPFNFRQNVRRKKRDANKENKIEPERS